MPGHVLRIVPVVRYVFLQVAVRSGPDSLKKIHAESACVVLMDDGLSR